MKNIDKLTPEILRKIIQEERKKLASGEKKSEKSRLEEVKRDLKTFLSLKREEKYLKERIKKINLRAKSIKSKIKES